MLMTSKLVEIFSVGILCILLLLSGCSGISPIDTTSSDPSATETAKDEIESTTPTTAGGLLADTSTSKKPTNSPIDETSAPEGLLIVDVVENEQGLNNEVVQYNRTIFNQSPTLDDAVTEAIIINSTQTRDLSSQEVRRVERVAGEYDKPTGEFIVSKNGTIVDISIGYEM